MHTLPICNIHCVLQVIHFTTWNNCQFCIFFCTELIEAMQSRVLLLRKQSNVFLSLFISRSQLSSSCICGNGTFEPSYWLVYEPIAVLSINENQKRILKIYCIVRVLQWFPLRFLLLNLSLWDQDRVIGSMQSDATWCKPAEVRLLLSRKPWADSP